MKTYKLKYKYEPKFVSNENPIMFGSELASGFDLYADIEKPIKLGSLDRAIIPTGLYFDLNNEPSYEVPIEMDIFTPIGPDLPMVMKKRNFTLEVQVRSRSGLAAKNGIMVLNSPGTIDNDYRGEIKVILINLSKEDFIVEPNMRIAQCVPSFIPNRENDILLIEKVDELSETERGTGGFGSTGLH